jgi:hypothetical protein
MKNLTEKLVAFLKQILAAIPEVKAVALISIDGIPIASVLPHEFDENQIAKLTNGLISQGKKVSDEFKQGELRFLNVLNENGAFFITKAGSNAVLSVLTTREIRFGLIALDMKRAAERIAEILPSASENKQLSVKEEEDYSSYRKKCGRCGTIISNRKDAQFCPYCGFKLKNRKIF